MPRLHNQDLDPLKTPLERAERMFQEQLDAAIETIVPKRRDLFIETLHDAGLSLKGLRETVEAKRLRNARRT